MALCTKRCKDCKYSRLLTAQIDHSQTYYCDYISIENHPRPCEAGDNCTVFAKRRKKRRGKAYENT